MKRFYILTFCLAIYSATLFSQDEEKKAPTVKVSGWVNAETMYDTRQTVASREGEILLYPTPVKEDANGDDINGTSRWNMLSFMSRVRLDASEMEAFGAKTTAKIEVDFLGTGNDFVNMIRMRHAFVNMKWDKTELLFGQYWHPMFVPECYPQVFVQGAAVTMNPLNRSPQIRFTYHLTNELSVLGAMLTQQYHKDIQGSDVARNSGRPEIQFQLMYKSDFITSGITGGYHWIRPRMVTDSNIVADELLGAYNMNAFVKVKTGDLTVKLEGVYGQNLSRFVMLGGYGVSEVEAATDQRTYSNVVTGSIWNEIIYSKKSYEIGLFTGLSKNFGTADDIVSSIYMRGYSKNSIGDNSKNDINYLFNIIPRVAFMSGKMKFGAEVIYMNAAYGTANSKLQVEDTEAAENFRFLFSVYRYF